MTTEDPLLTGISPMTPWRPGGPRWHLHLPASPELREYALAFDPVLRPHRDRLHLVPQDRLHCTLAWNILPATAHQRLLDPEAGDIADAIAEQCVSYLKYGDPGPSDGVPVTGLGWAPGGPHIALDRDAALPAQAAAFRGMAGTGGSHYVQPQLVGNWRPHVALGYATTSWPAEDVRRLDAELQAVATELPLPPPLPSSQLLLVLQDTFGPDGLDWTHSRLIGP